MKRCDDKFKIVKVFCEKSVTLLMHRRVYEISIFVRICFLPCCVLVPLFCNDIQFLARIAF